MYPLNGNFSQTPAVSNKPPSPHLVNQTSISPRPWDVSQEDLMIDILRNVFKRLPSNSETFQIAYHQTTPCELSVSRFRTMLESNIPEELKYKIQIVFITTFSSDSQSYDFIYSDEIQKKSEEIGMWKTYLKKYGNMLFRVQSISLDDLKTYLNSEQLIKRHVYPLSENNPTDYLVHIQHQSPPLIKSIFHTLFVHITAPQVAFQTSDKHYKLLLESIDMSSSTSIKINNLRIDTFSSLEKSNLYDVIYSDNLAELALIKEHLKPMGIFIFDTIACERDVKNLQVGYATKELLDDSVISIPMPDEHLPFVSKCTNLFNQYNVKIEKFAILYNGEKFEYVFLITHDNNKNFESKFP